ncbi:MAG: hypothetical protein L3J78_02030, partial [Thermoplasmata archaeon]|nr:hypothetical protein [Thermoplasmata archaeon]
DAERFEAAIERLESGDIVALHPETGEGRSLTPRPKGGVTRVVVVWTRDGAFASGLPPKSSKD